MTCPPPISTLFPYTTLFRSETSNESNGASCSAIAGTSPGHGTSSVTWGGIPCEGFDTQVRSKPSHGIDRKSTRLNSSHTVISYAVFCLKKKKKKKKNIRVNQ